MTRINCILFLSIVLFKFQCFSQIIENDIFGDFSHKSSDGLYNAFLKKDIFDNLSFTDSNKNEIVFKKKYLKLNYNKVTEDIHAKILFFKDLINVHRDNIEYKITYSINIHDKVVVEDNRGFKEEIGKNIFNGLEYKSNEKQASLKKDIFNYWVYEDSSGNKFQFSNRTWRNLKHTHYSNENVFTFLINSFLLF